MSEFDSQVDEPQSHVSLARVAKIVIPVAVVGLALFWWSRTLESKARSDMASDVVARMFSPTVVPDSVSMDYPDADQDMVADAPADPAQCINPETLTFSFVAASEEESPPEEAWKELLEALQAKTGKEVKLVQYTNADDQLAALKKGELHIAALNTGLVQSAVERDGFVPLCTFGRSDGTWGYTMEFLVPAGSPIKSPADIKGHKVTFTRVDSNSGCKAPFVLLKEEYHLLPERDYEYSFSLGHEDSIKRVAAKEFEVAPVASDVLARMIEKGEVDPQVVVSIYKSERFPPATIGYIYNLTPELRDGIREVLLGFDWSGTGLEKEFGPETTKFVPINYKDDWANTRRIDQVIAQSRRTSGGGI